MVDGEWLMVYGAWWNQRGMALRQAGFRTSGFQMRQGPPLSTLASNTGFGARRASAAQTRKATYGSAIRSQRMRQIGEEPGHQPSNIKHQTSTINHSPLSLCLYCAYSVYIHLGPFSGCHRPSAATVAWCVATCGHAATPSRNALRNGPSSGRIVTSKGY